MFSYYTLIHCLHKRKENDNFKGVVVNRVVFSFLPLDLVSTQMDPYHLQ